MFRRNRIRLPAGMTLVTRHDCPLCDDAMSAIESVGSAGPIEVRDVDSDPELVRFDERVPVLLDANGEVVAEGRITLRELRAAAVAARPRRT